MAFNLLPRRSAPAPHDAERRCRRSRSLYFATVNELEIHFPIIQPKILTPDDGNRQQPLRVSFR